MQLVTWLSKLAVVPGKQYPYKTLPSTSRQLGPGWLESPRGISHVRNDKTPFKEAPPLLKCARSNYAERVCVRPHVGGTPHDSDENRRMF